MSVLMAVFLVMPRKKAIAAHGLGSGWEARFECLFDHTIFCLPLRADMACYITLQVIITMRATATKTWYDKGLFHAP
jgi:hypothetical protein